MAGVVPDDDARCIGGPVENPKKVAAKGPGGAAHHDDVHRVGTGTNRAAQPGGTKLEHAAEHVHHALCGTGDLRARLSQQRSKF